MIVNSVKKVCDSNGEITMEELSLGAVYMTISNPQAFGKVLPGQYVFVDLIPTDKDSL